MHDAHFEQAMDLAQAGETEAALELMRPLLLKDEARPYALLIMGVCHESSDSLVTARYLYQEALAGDSTLKIATDRLEKCSAAIEERGLYENFNDSGHISCPKCALRHRAEYNKCPYCDPTFGQDHVVEEPEEPQEELPAWEDQSKLDQIKQASEEALQRVRQFTSREDVQEVARKSYKVGESTLQKIKDFVDSDEVKEAGRKAEEVGKQAIAKVRELGKSDSVQNIRKTVKTAGRDVAEKAKKFSGREGDEQGSDTIRELGRRAADEAKEFTKRPQVEDFTRKVEGLGTRITKWGRAWIKGEAGKFRSADEAGRAFLVLKWVALFIAVSILAALITPNGCR